MREGRSHLVHVRFGGVAQSPRLGGSAFAQCFGQIGAESARVDDAACFVRAFEVVQRWVADGRVRAGHDISDGGLVSVVRLRAS